MSFPFFPTKTDVSDNGLSDIVSTTHTNCWLQSFSAIIVARVFPRLSTVLSGSGSSTARIDTGGELNASIFHSAGKMTSVTLLINDVPRMTRTARFQKIPNMRRMDISPIWTWSMFVSTTSTSWLVMRFIHGRSQERIDSGKLSWTGPLEANYARCRCQKRNRQGSYET